MLPAEMGCGSGVTCWRRLRDLQAGGVWDEHRETTTAAVERGPDRLEPRLHGQFIYRRQKRGTATGPNPTDRGIVALERRGDARDFVLHPSGHCTGAHS